MVILNKQQPRPIRSYFAFSYRLCNLMHQLIWLACCRLGLGVCWVGMMPTDIHSYLGYDLVYSERCINIGCLFRLLLGSVFYPN